MKRYEATAGQIWTLKSNNGICRPAMILAVAFSSITTINVDPWEPNGRFTELEELIVPKEVGLSVQSVARVDSIFNNRINNLVDYIGTVDREYYNDVVHVISDYYLGRVVLDENMRCFTYPSRSRRYLYDDTVSEKQSKVEDPIIEQSNEKDSIMKWNKPHTEYTNIGLMPITPGPIYQGIDNTTPGVPLPDSLLPDEFDSIRMAIQKHFKDDGFTTISLNGYSISNDNGSLEPRKPTTTTHASAPIPDIYNGTFTEEMVSDILTLPVINAGTKYNISYGQTQYLRALLRSYLGLKPSKSFINFPVGKDCDYVTVEELEELNPDVPKFKLAQILNRRRLYSRDMGTDKGYENQQKPKFVWSFTFNRDELDGIIDSKDVYNTYGIAARMDKYMYNLKDKINDKIINLDPTDLSLSEDDLAVKYGLEPGTELARYFHIMSSRAFYKTNRSAKPSIPDELFLEFATMDNGDKLLQFCKDSLSYPKTIYTQARLLLAKKTVDNIKPKDLSHLTTVIDIIREVDIDSIVLFSHITKSKFMETYNISEQLYSNLSAFIDKVPSKSRISLTRILNTFTIDELVYTHEIQDVLHSSFIIAKYIDAYGTPVQNAIRIIVNLIDVVYDAIVLDSLNLDDNNSINICKEKEYEFQKSKTMKRVSQNVTKLLDRISEI